MSTVEVRSIDALEDLQTSLIRYADQAQATLEAAQRELQRTLDWLDERVRHWRNEVARCQEMERRAAAAYQRCMTSGDRDHPPSCGREEQAVQEAHRRLAEAQREERTATQARQAVQTEAEAYLREAGRLSVIIQSDMPKAVATLRHKVETLRAYTSAGMAGQSDTLVNKVAEPRTLHLPPDEVLDGTRFAEQSILLGKGESQQVGAGTQGDRVGEVMRIPSNASIPHEKLTHYLLAHRAKNDKSQYLARAGFTQAHPETLEIAIRQLVAHTEAVVDRQDVYGVFLQAAGDLEGPRGTLSVVTVWIVQASNGVCRFVTLKPAR